MMKLADLADFFKKHDYTWTYKEGKRVPTADELGILIAKIKSQLNTDEEASQIEIGRLLIKKDGASFLTYVLADVSRRDEL